MRTTVSVVLALVLAVAAARAEDDSSTATLTGRVTDATGAVIAGASVRAMGPSAEKAGTTDPGGVYILVGLAPGRYAVTVTETHSDKSTRSFGEVVTTAAFNGRIVITSGPG